MNEPDPIIRECYDLLCSVSFWLKPASADGKIVMADVHTKIRQLEQLLGVTDPLFLPLITLQMPLPNPRGDVGIPGNHNPDSFPAYGQALCPGCGCVRPFTSYRPQFIKRQICSREDRIRPEMNWTPDLTPPTPG